MNESQKSALENQFPRIAEKVALLWGHPEMDTFFANLAMDTRGDREGFPPEVMSELMFLSLIHPLAYPFEKTRPQYANRGFHSGMVFN
jgi:hypothetical protein